MMKLNVLSALNRSLRQIAGPDALTTECLSSPKSDTAAGGVRV
jgi:hypothetical protein